MIKTETLHAIVHTLEWIVILAIVLLKLKGRRRWLNI